MSRIAGHRHQDTPMRQAKVEVKEELEDVNSPVIPAGYEVPSALHNKAKDGDCPNMSSGLVASVADLEKDFPDFMENT